MDDLLFALGSGLILTLRPEKRPLEDGAPGVPWLPKKDMMTISSRCTDCRFLW